MAFRLQDILWYSGHARRDTDEQWIPECDSGLTNKEKAIHNWQNESFLQKTCVCAIFLLLLRFPQKETPEISAALKKDNQFMNWIILIIAGLCETGFAFCLGKGNIETGHKATLWYIAFIVALVLSMVLLAKATKTIPLSIAYPVWTGIGAVGTVIVGMLIFKEPASFWKLFFICTLIGSVIGLKLVH